MLRAEGFGGVRFYTPLPQHEVVPLFYLPLDDSKSIAFFFRSIFPLLDTISSEAKKAYALEYALAKLVVQIALFCRLTWLARYFVPGFSIIAQKSENYLE